MTLIELLNKIAQTTGYSFSAGEDNDGQVVLYTGLMESRDIRNLKSPLNPPLVEFEPQEEKGG